MTSTQQHPGSISGIRRRAAGVALALAIVFLLAAVVIPLAQAQTYSVLHAFHGADGAMPMGALIGDKAGNLYGITKFGGDFSCSWNGCGTVFKLDHDGALTTLHVFAGPPTDGTWGCSDSDGCPSGFVRDAVGNLYGTTSAGGASGNGIVFKLDATGSETVLYHFTGGDDGGQPTSLIRDEAGNLYGTTHYGGDPTCGWKGCGTVFELDTTGRLTTLHTFNFDDGYEPSGALIRDAEGNFYGTTQLGGTGDNAVGTVFKLDATGALTTLHTFTNSKRDGSSPMGSLIRDAAGKIYGTTFLGGTYGYGMVFKLLANGKMANLHSFAFGDEGGTWPQTGLIRDAAGNLYGTTSGGGDAVQGVVFKLNVMTRVETVLHTFTAKADGGSPYGALIQDNRNGNLYGTSQIGGDRTCGQYRQGCGVVFKIELQ